MNNDKQGSERHAGNLVQPRRAFAAWRNRRANIRPVIDTALAQTP